MGQFVIVENLLPGSSYEDVVQKDAHGKICGTLLDVMRHTDIKSWAMKIKHEHEVLFHVMQIYLGTVVSSSYVETMFSTAGRVWPPTKANLSESNFECQTILKKGRVLVEKYMKAMKERRFH